VRNWRTWGYGVLTYLGHERLSRWRARPAGRAGQATVEAVLGGGSVRVAGGAAGGLRMCSDHLPVDHAQGYGLIRGVLEPGVQEALRRHVRPGDVVYDVGANLGFYALLAARLTGPGGRVEAFEPVPGNAAAVACNAALNGFGNIAVHAVAVGAQEGEGELLVARDAGWSHLRDRGWHPYTRGRLRVPVLALDTLIERGELPPPDVVKIDVEGSEIAVLEGLSATLRARRVTVVCELHETNAEIAALLEGVGYVAENLDGPDDLRDAGGAVHVLARPAAAVESSR
jgi:FkbM family methyltransferase